MRTIFSILLIFFLLAVPVLAQCPAGVDHFFPSDLAPTGLRDIQCASVTVANRLWTAGVFSNGFDTRLKVFDGKAAGSGPLFESVERLFGKPTEVSAVDLNHDGVAEISVTSDVRGSTAAWFFSIDAQGTAVLLSPGSDVDDGPLTNIQLIDTAGKGTLDILDLKIADELDEDGLKVVTPTFTLYRSEAGGVLSRVTNEIYFANGATRVKGKPEEQTFTFVVPAAGTYPITLLNGANGGERCSSAVVTINGNSVFRESDFKKSVTRLTGSVSLQTENTLAIELKSQPGCSVFLMISKAAL